MRNRYLGTKTPWPDLDKPDCCKEGDDDPYDAIETFFDYLYSEDSSAQE